MSSAAAGQSEAGAKHEKHRLNRSCKSFCVLAKVDGSEILYKWGLSVKV